MRHIATVEFRAYFNGTDEAPETVYWERIDLGEFEGFSEDAALDMIHDKIDVQSVLEVHNSAPMDVRVSYEEVRPVFGISHTFQTDDERERPVYGKDSEQEYSGHQRDYPLCFGEYGD